jgi:hypothetical protein
MHAYVIGCSTEILNINEVELISVQDFHVPKIEFSKRQ